MGDAKAFLWGGWRWHSERAQGWLPFARRLFSLLRERPDCFLITSAFLRVSLPCLFDALAGQMPGPGSMMPGQPMPGRMMPSVSANIHPAGGGPPPPGMSPMSGNLIGPRVPLAAPNGMCK